MIPNRIYQVKGTDKFWVYVDDVFGFYSLCGAPCWWEGHIEFIDTNKNVEKSIYLWKTINGII